MDRRSFIQKTAAAAALAPTAIAACPACLETYSKRDWPFYVECFVRQQKEWVFSEYIKGPFTTIPSKYVGWMVDGKLRFKELDDAINYIEMHQKASTVNVNAHDVIYEVYYEREWHDRPVHQHVGHFWYNGDTGKNIYWRSQNPVKETNWAAVECS